MTVQKRDTTQPETIYYLERLKTILQEKADKTMANPDYLCFRRGDYCLGLETAIDLVESMILERKALEFTRFEICRFPPNQDPCEACRQTEKQLYFRPFSAAVDGREGQYYCIDCIIQEMEDFQRD